MKMAKASEADLRMAMDLANVLGDIERGYFPGKLNEDSDEDETEWIDTDDREQYARLVDGLKRLLGQGSISRVTWGMAVVCDPSNECIDPDADCIEHHPNRIKAEAQRDELLAAMKAMLDKFDIEWRGREFIRAAIANIEGPWCCEKGQAQGKQVCPECAEINDGYQSCLGPTPSDTPVFGTDDTEGGAA